MRTPEGGELKCASDAEEGGLVEGAGVVEPCGAGGYVRFVSDTGSKMNCVKPITRGMHAFGCGQCIPCTIKRRRQWAHRIILENAIAGDSAFLTLTYDDSNLPLVSSPGSLANNFTEMKIPTLFPQDLSDWLKRLRWALSPLKIRFYAVGEYGNETHRPHYHAAVFGLPSCDRGRTIRVPNSNRADWANCCDVCRLVGETWDKGDIEVGDINYQSANYIARYVTKKMNRKDDARLQGRLPEFSRSSLYPGIGAPAIPQLAESLRRCGFLDKNLDVPHTFRHGDVEMPLGRYMRSKLRLELGLLKNTPKEAMLAFDPKMLDLRLAARSDEAQPSFTKKVIEANKGKVASALKRYEIFKQREWL